MPNARTATDAVPDGIDVLMHPTAVSGPPLVDSHDAADYAQDLLTTPASLAGLPALNVPIGVDSQGFPQGVSVVGQWGCEQCVFGVAKELETANASVGGV